MKKLTFITLIIAATIIFTACSSEKPLTEAQQAQERGMTLEEYKEYKEAAARMNMTVDKHSTMDEEEEDMEENEE